MATQGDIVFIVGADSTGLVDAGRAGEQSLAKMEQAAKKAEAQLIAMGKVATDFKGQVANLAKENRAMYDALRSAGQAAQANQQHFNQLLGVQKATAASARESADAFAAFERSKAAVDALRASIDPVFAASKRYEAALVQLDAALEMGTISAGQHAAMIDQLAATYLRAGNSASTVATAGGGIAGMIASNRGAIQGFSYQIQDVAVQLSSGASAATVFAQQGSQVASAFGPWGAAAGAAIAVLAPLAGVLLSNAEAAEELNAKVKAQTELLEALRSASERLRLEREMASSGAQFEDEQRALDRINELTREREKIQRQINSALSEEQIIASAGRSANSARVLREQQETLRVQLEQIDAELRTLNLERAKTMAINASNAAAQQMQSIMRTLSNTDISSPWQTVLGWVRQAADEAQRFASSTLYAKQLQRSGMTSGPDAARSAVQFGGGTMFTPDASGAGLPATASTGGGGGGGGGANPLVAQVEALRNSLMSQEQLQLQAYQTQQQQLEQALEAQLVTRQEYAALTEAAQTKHQEAMSRIDVYRYGTGLQQAGAFMGDMASALQNGNEEMLRIARVFNAAQALINAWGAYAAALNSPGPMPLLARIAGAASILSAGMGAVAAIRGGGRGSSGTAAAAASSAGSGGGGNASSATATPARPLEVRLTGPWANSLGGLLDQLNAEAGDRGYRLMVAR